MRFVGLQILVAVFSLKLCGADAPAPPAAPDAARIAGWIAQLGDADFVARKAAEEELARAGAAAQKGLEGAVRSEDAEVRERAERLLSRLRAGQILKKLDEAAPISQSVGADLKLFQNDGDGVSKAEGSGHFKALPDGKHKMLEMTVSTTGEMAIKVKVKMVADGTCWWAETDLSGGFTSRTVQKYSLKAWEENREGMDFVVRFMDRPAEQLKEFRKRFNFTAGRDGAFDGAEVYILDGGAPTPRPPAWPI